MGNTSPDFRILIVDDSQEVHTVFTKILLYQPQSSLLDRLGNLFSESKKEDDFNRFPTYEIHYATQGEQAVKLVSEALQNNKPFALAFVDIRMPPGWDGIKTIQGIWQLDKDVQIVICTAGNDYSWEETIVHLGAVHNFLILKKPFDAIAVRQLASALTRKWQLNRESQQYTHLLEQQVEERTVQLQRQATHDSLTDLPNRSLLTNQLNDLILNAKFEKEIIAIFFMDLDRFKLINDSLTHAFGDQLLQAVSERLKTAVSMYPNIVARLGGDEFVVVVHHLTIPEEANKIAQIILKELHQAFYIANRELIITTSVGISLYPKDGIDAEILLRNADTAMYKAKGRGPNNFQYYSKNLNIHSLGRLELENQLFQALKNNEFLLYYQPEINLLTGALTGVEALIRWQHPQRGIVPPLDFIPIAEETGLILPLGEWVLKTACRQNKLWQDKDFPRFCVAINVAGGQFEPALIEAVRQALHETGLDPQLLELELNENVVINNIEVIQTVRALKALNIQIALDDFGTGYSNLSYLKKLPVDRIKIDRTYISNIGVNSDDEAIVCAIIAVAKSLNLNVLAEGVETKEQCQFLIAKECNEAQGNFFSEPLTPSALEKYLVTYRNTLQKS